jgi:NAD(P)-dependent dehydrogenase (short-subunit alcohol dehydrogenase family)
VSTKVALITGAARGIGAATARLFVEHGYPVVIADVLDEGAVLCNELTAGGGACVYHRCDVSNEADVQASVAVAVDTFGSLDVLVNNAGVVLVKPLDEIGWDEFRRVVDVNLGGTFLGCKHALPVMKRQGSGVIVNVASVSGHVGQTDHAVYGATKGAILALTRALAWEVAPYGIRVNSVSPGSVDTPMLRGDIDLESTRTGRSVAELIEEREAEQAFGRWADPSEIATAILFLSGDGASFVTGSDLLVDCGWVAK